MTTAAGEEAPWNFQHEGDPPPVCETTVKVGKKLFMLDGMLERVLAKARMAMGRPDEQPVDYVREDGERITVSARSFERLLRQAGPGPGSVTGNSRILTVLVALNTALLIGIGGWLLVTVSEHDKDIAVLKCQANPECREAFARART